MEYTSILHLYFVLWQWALKHNYVLDDKVPEFVCFKSSNLLLCYVGKKKKKEWFFPNHFFKLFMIFITGSGPSPAFSIQPLSTEESQHIVGFSSCRSCPKSLIMHAEVFRLYVLRHEPPFEQKGILRERVSLLSRSRWITSSHSKLLIGSTLALTENWLVSISSHLHSGPNEQCFLCVVSV